MHPGKRKTDAGQHPIYGILKAENKLKQQNLGQISEELEQQIDRMNDGYASPTKAVVGGGQHRKRAQPRELQGGFAMKIQQASGVEAGEDKDFVAPLPPSRRKF